jgi:hypothetical protein
MLDKSNKPASISPDPLFRNSYFYILALFNVLFLAYVFTVGYHNRLAWDDYAFMGHLRDHGFLSPFTFWYTHWQGRFGPQFFINLVLSIYKVIPSLLFYTVIITSLFIYSIYEILKSYFPVSKWLLLNYSILLFSALFLTTFELNTFFLLNVSAMYFGGVLFALIGIVFLIKKDQSLYHYIAVAFCFLYAGSSAEHTGLLASFIVGLLILYNLYQSSFNYRAFLSLVSNRKMLVAFFFCFAALVIMILAPGNKIRMTAFQQVTDPMEILVISYNSTVQILYHIFYRLPYTISFAIPFILFGLYLRDKVQIVRISIIYVVLASAVVQWLLIFISNLPVTYAMGTVGPMRSYVFISFFVMTNLFLVCTYIGYSYVPSLKVTRVLAGVSVAILIVFVGYTFYKELPLLRKYSQTDKARVALLNVYKDQGRMEKASLQPLYAPKYVTITDMFRILTGTHDLPTDMTDMPVFIGEIGQIPDWRNNHIKFGLGLDFEIVLSPNVELSKSEMDSIKMHASFSYETTKFRFYILDNTIYYQIHTPSFERLPAYIYCRIEPVHLSIFGKKGAQKYIHDFPISDQQVRYSGDVPGYEEYIFLKNEITNLPIRKLETGFYDMVDGHQEHSNGIEIQFRPNW